MDVGMINRRRLLTASGAALFAPAIVRAGVLMPVRRVPSVYCRQVTYTVSREAVFPNEWYIISPPGGITRIGSTAPLFYADDSKWEWLA